MGGKTEDDVRAQIKLIPERLTEIFETADQQQKPTNLIADIMAESIVAAGKA